LLSLCEGRTPRLSVVRSPSTLGRRCYFPSFFLRGGHDPSERGRSLSWDFPSSPEYLVLACRGLPVIAETPQSSGGGVWVGGASEGITGCREHVLGCWGGLGVCLWEELCRLRNSRQNSRLDRSVWTNSPRCPQRPPFQGLSPRPQARAGMASVLVLAGWSGVLAAWRWQWEEGEGSQYGSPPHPGRLALRTCHLYGG
jgi:hypothetical protein